MIAARNLTLTVGSKTLLKGIDLEVSPGQFTAVAGPNGAGKTSLLKVLSGEAKNYTGNVTINNTTVKSMTAVDLARVRSVLPQSSHLQFPFSVRQIIEMGTQHQQPSDRGKVMDEVMELAGISSWRDRNYLTLSGGEQQRVQLARVLTQVWSIKSFPRFILLDEPTSSLDLAQQQTIFSLVKQACDRNIGVLAIVHDLNQVTQFADRLYFLKEGIIVASGETKKVFTKHIIEETFCCRVNVYHDPCTNCPYIIPDKQVPETLIKVSNS